MTTLAEGVLPFEPQYALWSDSAAKKRWVKLPPGSQIDTSEMDYWVYPVGTKLFKEFTRDDVRVETRLLEKVGEGDWFMRAFQWNEAQTDAEARPTVSSTPRAPNTTSPAKTSVSIATTRCRTWRSDSRRYNCRTTATA